MGGCGWEGGPKQKHILACSAIHETTSGTTTEESHPTIRSDFFSLSLLFFLFLLPFLPLLLSSNRSTIGHCGSAITDARISETTWERAVQMSSPSWLHALTVALATQTCIPG